MATPEKAVSQKFVLGSKPLSEAKKTGPALPRPTVSVDLKQVNGIDGIEVTTFYPMPDDNQIEVTERMGRNTLKQDPNDPTKQIGQDNSDKIASILKVIGAARKFELVYNAPNDPNDPSKGFTEVLLTDDQGNPMKYTGTVSIRIKGEGADDEDEGSED